ncbi:phage protein DNA packaging protein [Secundilactobacillus pentosiphilus]|uniref:Phage protein DNA packaging protein n=1 Tax=Secundilactobacillus pentosiphilus TaxID=1714682 RepID=A0A1Z5IZI4_9LACO|nr:head-tail connector protein [Secundilactobacillus pentosiphilus]GAX06948.1 phage protein DNA packaging protein [Secundilactobacillus pentosiphilus]
MADETDELLDDLKLSLRIDGDDDDSLLNRLLSAARSNIVGKVGNNITGFYDHNDEFNWAVMLLASHWYINRSATDDVERYETPIALEDLTLSLKELYLVAERGVDDGQTDSGISI